MKTLTQKQIVLCIQNKGYEASLEVRKLYRLIPDSEAAKQGLVRIIDESGEDYLYPKSFFTSVSLPQEIRKKLFSMPRRLRSTKALASVGR